MRKGNVGMKDSEIWNIPVTGERLDWNDVKGRVDLVRVITSFLGPAPGRRGERGRRLWWRCPFHEDKNPSFCADPGKPWWQCYGCGESGDAANLVMRLKVVGFPEAIQFLAEFSGIIPGTDSIIQKPPTTLGSGRFLDSGLASNRVQKPQSTPPKGGEVSGLPTDEAVKLVNEASSLLWEPVGSRAREYLHDRGLTDETIQSARLGWTPMVSVPTRAGDRCYRA